jgi:hypothetical protein
MSLRDDVLDMRIRRAHLIDMASMAEPCEPGCNTCGRCVARRYAIAAGAVIALGCAYYVYRKVRHGA